MKAGILKTQKLITRKKLLEQDRLITVLERRFPGFAQAVRYAEVATPKTIERYTMKNGGAVAGPKQMLGQHLFKRLHSRTEWDNLYCCGESTVMGTGTPTVTTSGLSAANAVLLKLGKEPFIYRKEMKNFVRIVDKPFTKDRLFKSYDEPTKKAMKFSMRCRLCEHPLCTMGEKTDIRGIMRRVSVGNFMGAWKCWLKAPVDQFALSQFEDACICANEDEGPVAMRKVIGYLCEVNS